MRVLLADTRMRASTSAAADACPASSAAAYVSLPHAKRCRRRLPRLEWCCRRQPAQASADADVSLLKPVLLPTSACSKPVLLPVPALPKALRPALLLMPA